MKKVTTGALLALSLFANGAFAETGLYLEAELGAATYTYQDSSDSDFSFAFGGGYEFNQHISVHAHYRDYGAVSSSSTDDSGYNLNAHFATTAVTAGVTATLPVGKRFSAFGLLGMSFWEAEGSLSLVGNDVSALDAGSKTGHDIAFGLGALWRTNRYLSVGAHYEILSIGDLELDLNTTTAFIRFHF